MPVLPRGILVSGGAGFLGSHLRSSIFGDLLRRNENLSPIAASRELLMRDAPLEQPKGGNLAWPALDWGDRI
jgi:hypothetical protein